MPTSAPGSRRGRGSPGRPTGARRAAAQRGFTLIELMVVVAIIALSAGLVALALRDSSADQLEREGQRLAALLEAARAESRATGLPVWWVPAGDTDAPGFRFVGLPDTAGLPRQWLDDDVRAQVVGGARVTLGPDALIGAQRIVLQLQQRQLVLATDGLAPFAVAADGEEQRP